MVRFKPTKVPFTIYMNLFQFLYGAIQTYRTSFLAGGPLPFQFLYGAIQTNVEGQFEER